MIKVNNHLVDLEKVSWICLNPQSIYFHVDRSGFCIEFDTPEEAKEVFEQLTNRLV